jgi:hypothetical protein
MHLSNSSTESPVREISTNPFDDTSDDDDTFFYQECDEDAGEQQEQESLFSDITTSTLLNSTPRSEAQEETNSQTTKSAITQRSENGKRVAPLSFDIQAVDAKPALNFSTMQRSLDFVSPLETALINRVDHLNSASGPRDSDDNSDGEETDNDDAKSDGVKNDSYLSRLKELSFYFVSPPRKVRENDKKGDSEEPGSQTENKSRAIYTDTPENKSLAPISTAFEDDVVGNAIISPLDEAKDVLHRMDAMESTLKKSKDKKKRKILRRKQKETEEDKKVLKKIESQPDNLTTDHRHAGSPWNRLIILEELGTASTWIILLLPYVAFIFAVLLDTRADLWESTSNMISTGQLCDSAVDGQLIPGPIVFPAALPRNEPCSYKYELVEGEGLLSQFGRNIDVADFEFKKLMANGVAFTSGPIEVPVLSSFLYGDVSYSSMSSASVSLVADGSVQFSTIVLQQRLDSTADGKWFPVSISNTRQLSMLCEKEGDSSSKSDIRWVCKSPNNVDVLFALPETSVLTGGAVRVDTIMSHTSEKHNVTAGNGSELISNSIEDKDGSEEADRSSPDDLLLEIARSVSYQFTCSSRFRTTILIVVRIGCLLLSITFTGFWFWSMGVNGFFLIGDCFSCFYRQRSEEEMMLNKKKKGTESSAHCLMEQYIPTPCKPGLSQLLLKRGHVVGMSLDYISRAAVSPSAIDLFISTSEPSVVVYVFLPQIVQ